MEFRFCKTCKSEKPRSEFYLNRSAKNGGNVCRSCKRASAARYRERHRERIRLAARKRTEDPAERAKRNAKAREKSRSDRERVLAHYGGSCQCCGESQYEFLTIDHIEGGGSKHRRSGGAGKIVRWLIGNGMPGGYRVLCWNCNAAAGIYGQCPRHKRVKAVHGRD